MQLQAHIPQHSLEAEQAVLGAILISPDAIVRAIEIVQPDFFYRNTHTIIYKTMIALFNKGTEIDLLTLTEALRKEGKLEDIGGTFYLTELNMAAPTASNIEFHCRIVEERWMKRALVDVSMDTIQSCNKDTSDALEEVDKAEARIFSIAEKRHKKGFLGTEQLAQKTLNHIQHIINKKDDNTLTGLETGFHRLDDITNGLQKSDLIILAARPSMGKTALALSICRHAAVINKIPVGIFSLEMSNEQLMLRLLSLQSGVPLKKIRGGGTIDDGEAKKLMDAIFELAEAPIYIDDSPALSITEMRAKTRRLKAENDIELVVVDYLQLMSSPKAESREREISIISRSLKQIAKEMNMPVMALAQLNRGIEARADKTPMLSDLRESGSIEQDADVVMFVNRREYYGITTYDDGAPTDGTAEIIIGKQRNGSTGDVKLAFVKEQTMFANLDTIHTLPAYLNTSYPDSF